MKKARPALVILIIFILHLASSGQQHRQGQIVVTRTRLQVLFGDLEGQWLKAIQNKDAAALDRILPDDFSVWTAAPPGSPTPRSDWQKAAFARNLQSFAMRQLAVRAVSPDVSVANFVLTQTFDQGGVSKTEENFVVDVWIKSGEGDSWRCTDRYITKLSPMSRPVMAHPTVKPDGKN